MVLGKNIKNKFALISVFNKSNLRYLCKNLEKNKYKFISTGSTYKKIRSLGFNCLELSKISGFKEILDGRIKTLNPKIYGSILHKRDNKNHIKQFNELKFPLIDIVIINFYPFKKFITKSDDKDIIEMIDIGGPSLIRAASKNYKFVTTIASIADYKNLVNNLNKNMGVTDIIFRKKMASKSFKSTSKYDSAINKWFDKEKDNNYIKLRYGENPNQNSFIKKNSSNTIFDFQISGKQISYNNIIDIDSGLKCLKEFQEPTCLIIKHNNACGVASSRNIELAFKKALQSDAKSAFGGIVMLNKKINNKLAKSLNSLFFEAIVAPDFEKQAIKILSNKKRLILLKIKNLNFKKQEYRSTLFGTIHQTLDQTKINDKFCKLVTNKQISKKLKDDLIFSLKVVKHLKSNAIVISSNKQTLGIGSGFTNRIDAIKIALKRYKEKFKKKKIVCASDGFFPFSDSLRLLKKNDCYIVAQPSGSLNDNKIIKYADRNNMSLYFIKNRLFKH